jgi:hypothetical protein
MFTYELTNTIYECDARVILYYIFPLIGYATKLVYGCISFLYTANLDISPSSCECHAIKNRDEFCNSPTHVS